jgi:hypothetical protein
VQVVESDFKTYFTPGMLASYQSIRSLGAGSNAAAGGGGSGGAGGLNSGAIAGIAIAIIVGEPPRWRPAACAGLSRDRQPSSLQQVQQADPK